MRPFVKLSQHQRVNAQVSQITIPKMKSMDYSRIWHTL